MTQNLTKLNDEQSLASALEGLLSVLSNCNPLYNAFLVCSEQFRNQAFVDFHNILYSMATHLTKQRMTYAKILKIGNDILNIEKPQIDGMPECMSVRIIFQSLMKILTQVSILHAEQDDDILLLLNAIESICIIDCSELDDTADVPLQSQDRSCSLLFALQINKDLRWSFIYRWNESNKWWYCPSLTSVPVKTSTFIFDSPTYLVYATPNSLKCLSENEYLNMIGAETKLTCHEHKCFLVKDFKGGKEICSICQKKRAYRCSFDLLPNQTCTAGLCSQHAKELRHSHNTVGVHARVESPPDVRVAHENIVTNESDPVLDVRNIGNTAADSVNDCNILVDLNIPEALNSGSDAIQREDYGDSTSGHFLLNSHLKCLTKTFINNKPPIKWQQQLGMINSLCPSQTFPLIQPENILFPGIFWDSIEPGCAVGALPSYFYGPHGRDKQIGTLASLIDHLRVRMRDGSSLTSTSKSYVGFVFDIMLNYQLKYNPVSVVFNKGLEDLVTVSSPAFSGESLGLDEIKSNTLAGHLAGMQRTVPWTYFVTFTCNDSMTFGVAPVHQAVVAMNLPEEEHNHQMQLLCMILTRCWHRSVRLFFKVLLKNDKMFGPVLRFVARKEYQSHGAPGNKFHVHCGITIKPEAYTESSAMERIVNRLNDGFSVKWHTDYQSLKEDGLVTDIDSWHHTQDTYSTLQRHSCAPRCKTTLYDGKPARCRNKCHPHSFKPSFQSFPEVYKKSFKIFQEFGLTDSDIHGEKVVERFCPGIYHPPTEDSSSVATIPLLQVVMGSQTNVQKCDIRGGTSYTAKYCAKKEEHRRVVITSKDKDTVITEPRDLFNEGITSARIAEEARLKRIKAPEALATEISYSEMCSFVHNEDYLLTNVELVKVQTVDLESRVVVTKSPRRSNRIIDASGKLTSIFTREQLPDNRKFTMNQLTLIKDFETSKYLVDQTSSFSIRSPEHMAVSKLEKYVQFFTRKPMYKEPVITAVLDDSHWIDGSHHQVRVRKYYLPELTEFYRSIDTPIGREMFTLLNDLMNEMNADVPSEKFKRYVDTDAVLEVSISFSNINPNQLHRLVYHMVLSMGEYETELDFAGLNLVEICAKSKLIPNAENVTIADADALTKRYLEEQMRFLSLTASQIDTRLPIIRHGIRNLFTNPDSSFGTAPLMTYRAISECANEMLAKYENDNLNNTVAALDHELPEVATMKERLLQKEAFDCSIAITQADNQPIESVTEQTAALHVCMDAINGYCSLGTTFQKSVLLCGPPGAGKTHVFLKAALFCLSKNLRIVITAITSERASKLGGIHLHHLFALPVFQSLVMSTANYATQTLGALGKNTLKFAFLRRIDVIFFEEISLLSANILATLDSVLRAVREVDVPMGGVLIIATGDQEQLKPIDGFSFFRSTHLITIFKVVLLKQMVRARSDADLKTIITLLRKHPLNDDDKIQILNIIKERCGPNFVSDWQDVPEGVLRIVGKKTAVDAAVRNYISLKLADPHCEVHIEKAEDLVEKSLGDWDPATPDIVEKLNYNSLELEKLHLFLGSTMKLTFNNTRISNKMPRFSQGQLAVVEKLPELEDPVVRVRIMPPGVRQTVGATLPECWPAAHLKKRSGNPIIVGTGYLKAKRNQYPLRHNVSSTIHKCIGESCNAIATKISKSDASYSLWELPQLLVLISRVPDLSNIIFVGSLTDTMDGIQQLLEIDDPSTALQAKIVEQANCLNNTASIIPATRMLNWNVIDCDVVSAEIGFVFLIASAKDLNVCKIGECSNIREHMVQINTPSLTDDFQYTPYVLMSYVCGFFGEAGGEQNRHHRTRYLSMAKKNFYHERGFDINYRNFLFTFEVMDDPEFFHLMLKECYKLPTM